MQPLYFLIVFLVPLSVIVGLLAGGWWTFVTPVLVFGLIPVLDLLLGKNVWNPSPPEEEALAANRTFRIITWACAPVQVGMVIWGAWVVSSRALTPLEFLGFSVSLGVSSGVLGINVSHELIHRIDNKLEPYLGRAMLWSVLYLHWAIEHVAGHHRNVATPGDAATARKGESFYRFLPRTVKDGFISSWEIESARLARKGKIPFHPANRILWYVAAEIVAVFLVFGYFGLAGLAFFLIQAAVAVGLLEIVNYVEHYGLLRKETAPGQYESVKPVHSWNSSNWLTNYFLFNLQRHSDHHFKPGRRYPLLRHYEQSPQLPTGYAGMLVLAAVPPLYWRVMDPRLEEHKAASEAP